MPSPLRWPDALLVGLASSMRSTAGPALLAARGHFTGRTRTAVLLASAGEVALDKSPLVPPRSSPVALPGRVASGAYSGHALAGPAGAVAGGVAAGVGSFATERARALVVERTGVPDPVVAAGEDVLAFTVAAVATRPPAEEEPGAEPRKRSVLRGAAEGLVAGLAGTAAMTLAQGAEFALLGAEPSDSPFQVADKISRKTGRGRIKRKDKRAVNQGMHWLYGASWGIPYGVITAGTKVRPEVSGPALGVVVWGAALAQYPALGLAAPPWKRSLESLGSELVFHLVYGVGAGAALRALRS